MNLANVMVELGALLETISGLNVTAYPPGTVNAPAAIVSMPERIDYDETYGRGSDHITLQVTLLVAGPTEVGTRDRLAQYADGSGAFSVKQVLESGTPVSYDVARVVSAEFDVYTVGGIAYAATIFTVEITGSGA